MVNKKYFIFVFLLTVVYCDSVQADLYQYLQSKLNHPFLSFVALTQKPNKKPNVIVLGLTRRSPLRKAQAISLYRVASLSKSFIATAVIKLVIAHHLRLNDKLNKYLAPKYLLGIKNANQVTIKQLLGMQSGIYNYTNNPKFFTLTKRHPQHHWSPMDALNLARNKPSNFVPGTAGLYSNTNYILLGLVIEKASGHSLVYELKHLIFKPLHLTHTYLTMHQPIPYPIATSYVYLGDGRYKKVTSNDGDGLADGGIVSNVYDVNTFIRNLMLNRKFMPLAYLKKMIDFHPMISSPPEKYGLGLVRFKFGQLILIGHDGSDTGRQSWMVYNSATEESLVVLTNTRPPFLNQKRIASAAFSSKH